MEHSKLAKWKGTPATTDRLQPAIHSISTSDHPVKSPNYGFGDLGMRALAIFVVSVALASGGAAAQGGSGTRGEAGSCVRTSYAAPNAQTLARAVVLSNECDRPIVVSFQWQGRSTSHGAAASCTGRPERVTLAPKRTHRTIETNCSSYAVEASYVAGAPAPPSGTMTARGEAGGCIVANHGNANAQTLARAIIIANQCDRPVQVAFQWQGQSTARGVAAPCAGPPERITLPPRGTHSTIETNCSSYAIEAVYASATPQGPGTPPGQGLMTGTWIGTKPPVKGYFGDCSIKETTILREENGRITGRFIWESRGKTGGAPVTGKREGNRVLLVLQYSEPAELRLTRVNDDVYSCESFGRDGKWHTCGCQLVRQR
jgi:hypothetical protein